MRVLLVGGSSDIGGAVVRRALEGTGPSAVVLAGRPSERLGRAAEALRQSGSTVSVVELDADDPAAASHLVKRASDLAAGLDLVVLATGELTGELDASAPDAPERLARSLAVNLTVPATLLVAAVGHLADRGGGRVVVLSSASAVRPRRSLLAYGLAKQALDRMAVELGPRARARGVRVLVVRPGQVRTQLTRGLPEPPLTSSPDAVARAVQSAWGRDADVVWVPRAMGVVMGVLRRLPSRLLPVSLR